MKKEAVPPQHRGVRASGARRKRYPIRPFNLSLTATVFSPVSRAPSPYALTAFHAVYATLLISRPELHGLHPSRGHRSPLLFAASPHCTLLCLYLRSPDK